MRANWIKGRKKLRVAAFDLDDCLIPDLEPLFSSSPALQGVFSDEPRVGQRGKRRDTILSRFFPGGSLILRPSTPIR
jgi:hypothetical protein